MFLYMFLYVVYVLFIWSLCVLYMLFHMLLICCLYGCMCFYTFFMCFYMFVIATPLAGSDPRQLATTSSIKGHGRRTQDIERGIATGERAREKTLYEIILTHPEECLVSRSGEGQEGVCRPFHVWGA